MPPSDAQFRIHENALRKSIAQQETIMALLAAQPRSITQEIDAIDGRRIFYVMTDSVNFTAAQLGLRGDPLQFTVSQDGPFVMTYFPLVMWKPNAPDSATRHGQWSAVGSWPLPVQHVTDIDRVDLSYEFFDGGSQRNFQSAASPPIFSRPDNLVPLPVPTIFMPNSSMNFIPTYESIDFAAGGTPATGGQLVVSLMGYRIVRG